MQARTSQSLHIATAEFPARSINRALDRVLELITPLCNPLASCAACLAGQAPSHSAGPLGHPPVIPIYVNTLQSIYYDPKACWLNSLSVSGIITNIKIPKVCKQTFPDAQS